MKLKPLHDRVLLQPLLAEEKTKSGIILPDSAKEKPQEARVVAVGPGIVKDGQTVAMSVKIDDVVIYSKYAGDEVKIDGVEYTLIEEDKILAIVEK